MREQKFAAPDQSIYSSIHSKIFTYPFKRIIQKKPAITYQLSVAMAGRAIRVVLELFGYFFFQEKK